MAKVNYCTCMRLTASRKVNRTDFHCRQCGGILQMRPAPRAGVVRKARGEGRKKS
jgi:hypothetical protein